MQIHCTTSRKIEELVKIRYVTVASKTTARMVVFCLFRVYHVHSQTTKKVKA